MSKIDLNKPFYLIATYWLGELQGFIKIGDDKEEIKSVVTKEQFESIKYEVE